MALTSGNFTWYDKAAKHLSRASYLSDDYRIALFTSGYVPDSVAHEYFDVHTSNQHAAVGGYTLGGLALTNKSVVEATPGRWVYSSDPVGWLVAGSNIVARYLVIYNNTPASNKPLIGWAHLNFNGGTPLDVTVTDTFSLTINTPANGWFYAQLVDA